MDDAGLKDAVILITGGSSGIGAAMVETFAHAGSIVCNLDLDEKGGGHLVDQLQVAGCRASFYKCDVTVLNNFKNVVRSIQEEYGTINILINNAGIAHIGNIEQTNEEDFQKVFDVNVKGVYHGMLSVVPIMKNQGGGVILNVGSIAAEIALPDRFAYTMSKGAVHSMTYAVARDYLSYNIRCNCIAPARVHTPFVDGYIRDNFPGKERETYQALANSQPIGRMGTTQEIAELAKFICSPKADFITGSMIPIDGGFIRLNT